MTLRGAGLGARKSVQMYTLYSLYTAVQNHRRVPCGGERSDMACRAPRSILTARSVRPVSPRGRGPWLQPPLTCLTTMTCDGHRPDRTQGREAWG